MKALLLVAALGLAGLQTAPQSPSPVASGTVSGVVRNTETNKPTAGATIHLNRTDVTPDFSPGLDRKPTIAKSDDNGRFTFNGLPTGTYVTWVEPPPSYVWMDRDKYEGGMRVTVGPAERAEEIVFGITPRGNISGRILGVNGEPLVGAVVEAACVIYRDGERKLGHCDGRQSKTDMQGNYRIYWLAPGKYYIRTEYHPVTVGNNPMVYFPGTLEEAQATPIAVKPGAELNGIDFQLVTPAYVPRFTISGKVVGMPTSVADKSIEPVFLHRHDGKPGGAGNSYPNTAPDIAGGRFQIRGIRSGVYELWTQVRDDDGLYYTARTTVEVAGANVEDVSVGILPVVDLHGTLFFDGKAPEKPLEQYNPPRIIPIDGTPDYVGSQFEPKGMQFNRNTGEFTIFRVPAGRYELSYFPSPLQDGYVADIRMGIQSVLDGFTTGRETPPKIEVLNSSDGGTVDGVAIGPDSNPYFGATVVIASVPETGRDIDWPWRANSDKAGHFTFPRLRPGLYKIYAWSNPPVGAPWRNADFMRRYESLGQIITVNAGKTTTVRVISIPGEAGE